MKKLSLILAVFLFAGCTKTKIVSQPIKLPNRCGNYDLVYGTLKADGLIITPSKKELKMTPIGMTEARAPEPLNIGANVGKNALVKGIYWGDQLYRAEIVEVVDLHSIDLQSIQERCNRVDPQIKKPTE